MHCQVTLSRRRRRKKGEELKSPGRNLQRTWFVRHGMYPSEIFTLCTIQNQLTCKCDFWQNAINNWLSRQGRLENVERPTPHSGVDSIYPCRALCLSESMR